jgi:hypothetical protein
VSDFQDSRENALVDLKRGSSLIEIDSWATGCSLLRLLCDGLTSGLIDSWATGCSLLRLLASSQN